MAGEVTIGKKEHAKRHEGIQIRDNSPAPSVNAGHLCDKEHPPAPLIPTGQEAHPREKFETSITDHGESSIRKSASIVPGIPSKIPRNGFKGEGTREAISLERPR